MPKAKANKFLWGFLEDRMDWECQYTSNWLCRNFWFLIWYQSQYKGIFLNWHITQVTQVTACLNLHEIKVKRMREVFVPFPSNHFTDKCHHEHEKNRRWCSLWVVNDFGRRFKILDCSSFRNNDFIKISSWYWQWLKTHRVQAIT